MQFRSLPVSPPSPTLTNPDMVLPQEDEAGPRFDTSAAELPVRPPSPTYLLEQVDMVAVDHAGPAPKKSLGSMSQRMALQRATTADDNPYFVHQEPKEPSQPRWEQRPIQRAISILSASTISLDLDAIPEYKYDDGESDIFTLDGTVTPTRSLVGDLDGSGIRPATARRTSEKFSAELSRRAELILANAKKRLNLMDKNLKGARALTAENLQRAASLHIHDSPYANRFMKSPDPEDSNPKRHLRNRSDITQMHSPVRARNDLVGESLAEESDDSIVRVATPLRISKSQELPKSTRMLSSSRSASRTQLKTTPEGTQTPESNVSSPGTDDLKKQVQSLNKRISLLRERTKEDSMKRQSFQNLRQPSPFTNAAHDEHTSPNGADQSADSRWSVDSSVKHVSIPPQPAAAADRQPFLRHSKRYSKPIDWTPIYPSRHPNPRSPPDSNGATSPTPPQKAHEDRPDAFDYHTFYLHSSLGRRPSTSTSSCPSSSSSTISSSDHTARGDTVTTPASAGPPPDETPEKLRQIEHKLHRRFSSFDSIASDASYATAPRSPLKQPPSAAPAPPPPTSPLKPHRDAASDGADSGIALLPPAPPPAREERLSLSSVAAQVGAIAAPRAAVAVAAVLREGLPPLGLRDRAGLFMLMESVQGVCARLQDQKTAAGVEGQVLRRRLEEARRVLEGVRPVVG